MDWHTLSVTVLCIGFGSLVQSTLGFGMGVVAIPLLVSSGYALPGAIGAILPNVLVQTVFSCCRNRHDLPWTDAWKMGLLRYGSLPLGVCVLGVVADRGEVVSRALVGVGLLTLLGVQQFQRPTTVRRCSRVETLAAGLSSGFLAGLIGMGGPTLVLWVLRQDWGVRRQRCFLWLSFLLVIPLQMAIMAWRFGRPWALATAYGLAAVPIVLLVAWLAGAWADGWSKDRLRRGMRLFLLVVAGRLIWQWALADV